MTAIRVQALPPNAGEHTETKNTTCYMCACRCGIRVTLRAGVSHGGQPIPSADAIINYLAPGVIEDHATLGLTWAVGKTGELSLSYMHAFNKNVSGAIPAAFGGGNINLRMYQDSLGIAYGWKM